MDTNAELMAQLAPYQPWLLLAAVFVLFLLLRLTRRGLRRHIDQIGYYFFREKGQLLWLWLNAPGVILHELSHAFVLLLFKPFGFEITGISLFRIKPMVVRSPGGRVIKSGLQSFQLGEVQYLRPPGRFMSYIGDGLSGVAPLLGGLAALTFLYWVATGFFLWDMPIDAHQHLQLLRPGWPWWTLTFTPYLILTVTSELWPSSRDWHEARWFVWMILLVALAALGLLWYLRRLEELLQVAMLVASRLDFALLILLLLDLVFLVIAQLVVQALRH